MVAGNSPPDLEAALHEIEALKRALAEQRRQVEFELKLLDLPLANIFDFLKEMEGKDDIAVACALARKMWRCLLRPRHKSVLAAAGFDVIKHATNDAAAGGRTVWLCQRRELR